LIPVYGPSWRVVITPVQPIGLQAHFFHQTFALIGALRRNIPVVFRPLERRAYIKTRFVKVVDVTITTFVRHDGRFYGINLVAHLFIDTYKKIIRSIHPE
jgi:hypothetical protein